MVLLGVARLDAFPEAERLAGKVARLRIFENEDGRFDRSLLDVGGEALVVSQFTLIADSRRQKGTRPDFSKAARPEVAEALYERFCVALRAEGVSVQTGVFGARMQVSLVNDGPVTIVLDVGS
jgi:D-tyrosyl-tRNA(Tyr) deacylase